MVKNNKKNTLLILLFCLPALVLFFIYVLIPSIEVIIYSLFEWDGMGEKVFIGLENYKNIITDENFFITLSNNFKLLIMGVPMWTFVPLLVAVLIHDNVKHSNFFKSAYYFPSVVSVAVMATLFKALFMYYGPINGIIEAAGGTPIEFWAIPNASLFLICIYTTWVGFGYNTLLYVAALSNYSAEIEEASIIDGAGWWTRLFKIKMPLIKPTIAMILMLNITSVFSGMFNTVYMMTGGGPGYGTTTLDYYVYTSAFKNHQFGYACAVAVILLIIIVLLGLIQHRYTKTTEGEL